MTKKPLSGESISCLRFEPDTSGKSEASLLGPTCSVSCCQLFMNRKLRSESRLFTLSRVTGFGLIIGFIEHL
jgi:hypothetical protein